MYGIEKKWKVFVLSGKFIEVKSFEMHAMNALTLLESKTLNYAFVDRMYCSLRRRSSSSSMSIFLARNEEIIEMNCADYTIIS